ncbi:hypothetical protein CDD83_2693 [Cordyceps sp. RAO-2017]|nr:hypothetical protein CDD83_2693 [Cordyceps sp. RAO-2017]
MHAAIRLSNKPYTRTRSQTVRAEFLSARGRPRRTYLSGPPGSPRANQRAPFASQGGRRDDQSPECGIPNLGPGRGTRAFCPFEAQEPLALSRHKSRLPFRGARTSYPFEKVRSGRGADRRRAPSAQSHHRPGPPTQPAGSVQAGTRVAGRPPACHRSVIPSPRGFDERRHRPSAATEQSLTQGQEPRRVQEDDG